MKRPLLSVIIPCYNEAATLPLILNQVEAVNLDKEIIIVDDHSTDETPAILEELRRSRPHITVIRHPHNRGKGAAVRSGLAHARGEITIVQDADLEYDPQDYYELVKQLPPVALMSSSAAVFLVAIPVCISGMRWGISF